MIQAIRIAFSDIYNGFRLRRVWLALASEDISDQHRRTTLGPFWLLINYLMFAAAFIFLMRVGSTENYMAYVATGLLVWFYIMETLTQAVSLFVREESFIKGTRLPLSVYVLRLSAQSTIRAGYALLGCLAFLALSGVAATAAWAWSVLGLMLLLATVPAAILTFAFLGAFFPDSQFIVTNLMRIGMFLTPVFWAPEGRGDLRGAFYHYNPFTYFIEIVRVPILTGEAPFFAFAVCVLAALILWILAIALLGLFRRQVVFVL